MMKSGLCMNVGNCTNANQHKVLEIGVGEDFVCPECHKSLLVYTPKKALPVVALVAGGLLLVVALAGVGWWMYTKPAADDVAPPVPVVETKPAPEVAPPPAPVQPVQPVAPAEPAAQSADRLPPCGSDDGDRRRLKLCD